MKFIYAIITMFMITSCTSKPGSHKSFKVLNDTIQTASGLRYMFIKHGDGQKVEKGSEVSTFLSLMVADSVVWTSEDQPDSLFTYIAGFTRLIKGFSEVSLLLREGDEIIAFLPDSLAYGAKGAGDVIPPHATLYYDQFKVVKVGQAKALLCDTLYKVMLNGGKDKMISRYEDIVNNSSNYHIDNLQLNYLWDRLMKDSKEQEAYEVAYYFSQRLDDPSLRFKLVESLEKLGQNEEAITYAKQMLVDEPDNLKLKEKITDLEGVQ